MKIVNINENDYDVFIGRPSKWGNPFKIGMDGDRLEVIRKYEKYIRNNKKLLEDLPELEGKILGCYCKPRKCHGDVLVKLIQEMKINSFFNGG